MASGGYSLVTASSLVSSVAFQGNIAKDLVTSGGAAAASLVTAVAVNTIHQRSAQSAFEDREHYLLWKLRNRKH